MATQTSLLKGSQITLKTAFGVLMIVAGIDKFVNFLVDWNIYLSDFIQNILPFSTDTFMLIVGIFEILLGVFIFTNKKTASTVLGVWLLLTAANLILANYYDIAARDIILAIAAFSIAPLSSARQKTV